MKFKVSLLILLIAIISISEGVENAQRRVAPALEECYRNRQLFERDNRVPMTINTLIELVRKVEDTPNFNMDIRQFAVALVHRFRQDGIRPASGVQPNQDDILPFSPSDFTFQKHRVLLTRLLPGNAQLFPNRSLTSQELCGLHFMLSTSIETQVRGDENVRCNQLAQFRSERLPRAANDDFEVINNNKKLLHKLKAGRLQAENEEQNEDDYLEEEKQEENVEEEPEAEPKVAEENDEGEEVVDEGVDITGRNVDVDIASTALSQCPVENGVISTPWGSISGGALITGIAAGLQPQTVQLRDLLTYSRSADQRKFARQQQGGALRVDNRFAATLSGDLAEALLLQAPRDTQVGAAGTFNSTMLPRWYFLSQRERLQMTDAEIRGGLDGLIIAQNIAEWRSRASNLRLSQVLALYYSHRGVFTPEIRACNRTNLFTTVAPIARLRDETNAFTRVLDNEIDTSVTLNDQAITRLSTQAADALASYIPQSMNNLGCAATARQGNVNLLRSTQSDLLIFVDTSLLYRDVQPILADLLNSLDFGLGQTDAEYTLFDAREGNVIVNTTRLASDLVVNWTQAVHTSLPNGFSIGNVYSTIRLRTTNMMLNERARPTVGGRSFIALIIVGEAVVADNDVHIARQQFQVMREQIPDLRFLYWARGTVTRFNQFVINPQRDVWTLQTLNVPSSQIREMTERIQAEPRRIINHRCGPEWQTDSWGSNNLIQHVGPREISFYRVAPNYFFRSSGNRRLQVRGSGFGPISVCHSREIEWPRMELNNTTVQGEVNCQTLNANVMDIDLSNPCDGHDFIMNCRPLFISVEGPAINTGNLACNDRNCRFPDDVRFTLTANEFGCFSSAKTYIASIALVILSFIFTIHF